MATSKDPDDQFADLESALSHLDDLVDTITAPDSTIKKRTENLEDLDDIISNLGKAFPSTAKARTLQPIRREDDVTKSQTLPSKFTPLKPPEKFSTLFSRKVSEKSSKPEPPKRQEPKPEIVMPKRPENFILFYNQDKSYRVLDVGEGQTSRDICSRLVIKNMAIEDPNWFLTEYLPECQLQRVVEDHEIVLDIYRGWTNKEENKFYFMNDYKKYEVFSNPAQFFPDHMVDTEDESESLSEEVEKAKLILLKRLFSQAEKSPDIQSYLFVRENRRSGWKRVFCVLRGTRICYSTKGTSKDPRFLETFATLHDKNIYLSRQPYMTFEAPHDFCICLKPENDEKLEAKDLQCISIDEERIFKCWLVGLRLAKYGNILRENYQIARRRQEKLKYLKEQNKIDGPYADQEWFHGKLDREDTNRRLKPFSKDDGVFLIRESRGLHVLSLVHDQSPNHYQIFLNNYDAETKYTLDDGATRFDDLTKLVEYYQENRASLPCLLTRCVQRPDTQNEQSDS